MAYLEAGEGRRCLRARLAGRLPHLVCGAGPLSKRHRVIAVSLRHFFPRTIGLRRDTYSIAQHVADVIAFIEQLDSARWI